MAAVARTRSLFPLVVLFGLNAVDELDRTAFSLLLPEIRDAFGLGTAGAATLAAAIIPAGLAFGIPVAHLADRRRRVPIAVAGACAWALFSLLTGLAGSVLMLAGARIGAGLGRAVNDPVHGSLLTDYYEPGIRARIFAAHRSANTVGAFCGPLAAGVIAGALGWRAPFFILAVPTIALIVLAVFLREPERTGRKEGAPTPSFRQSVRILWSVRTLRRIWLAIPLLASVAIGFGFLLSLYYRDVFGVGVRLRGLIAAFDAPFILLGLVVAAPIIDRGLRTDPGRVMRRIGLAAATIAPMLVGMAVAPSVWVAVAFAYAIVALGIVLLAGGTALVSLVAPPEARAAAFAFYGLFALLGIVVLPLVGVIGEIASLRWGLAGIAPLVLAGSLVLASAGRFVAGDIIDPPEPEPAAGSEAVR